MAYMRMGLALLFAAGLMAYPEVSAAAALAAMKTWARQVAPALFPFAAVMPFLTCPEARGLYGKMLGGMVGRIYGLPGGAAAALAVGLMSGSPAGALAARNVAAAEGMSRAQSTRLALLSCGVSPVFAMSAMGIGLFGSAEAGWRLCAAQISAQLMTGLIFRLYNEGGPSACAPLEVASEKPLWSAVMASLRVCGYMVLFSVGIALSERVAGREMGALSAFIDLPSGMLSIGNDMLAASALGFGGMCILCQNLGILGAGVNVPVFIAGKALCAALCAGAYAALCRLPELGISGPRELGYELSLLFAALIMLPVILFFAIKRPKRHLS